MSDKVQSEVAYRTSVQPAMYDILNKVGEDVVGRFGIPMDLFIRALWSYGQLLIEQNYTGTPGWLMDELAEKRRRAETSNVIEGEVSDGD